MRIFKVGKRQTVNGGAGAAVTAAVAVDSAAVSVRPAVVAVTRTESALPTSAGAGAYVAPVAPGTAAPAASHW